MSIVETTKQYLNVFNGEKVESTIVDGMEYAIESKNMIKDALKSKGADIDDNTKLREYAEKIDEIDEWKPHPDWWDINKILDEDAENYEGKIIALLTDSDNITTIYGRNASKIRTSDGSVYNNTQTSLQQSTTYSHTWDKTKDKQCRLGYKTRYIIWYYNNTSVNISPRFYENPKYIILSGMSRINYNVNGNNPPFSELRLLESIVFRNSIITNTSSINFSGDYSLKKIDNLKIQNNILFSANSTLLKEIPYEVVKKCYLDYQCIPNMINLKEIPTIQIGSNFGNNIYNLYQLEKINYLDTSNITSFRNFGNGCYNLTQIENLDFNNATDIGSMFSKCYSLATIKEVLNIKISGLNFSSCTLLNHATLLRILNALHDYSNSDETHILTLGAVNLAKLTEEEIAIATLKGWTVA